MTRKDKIKYLKSIVSGENNRPMLAPGESYWPPLCINIDGTDLLTGKPPTAERIAAAKRMKGGGFVLFTDGTPQPDWLTIYNLEP